MKKIGLAALAAVLISGSAYAADIDTGGRGSLKDDAAALSDRARFVGLGVTIFGGGQFTNVEIGDGDYSFDGIGADGLAVGIGAEYLLGYGRFRFGPYVEGALSNVNTNIELGSSGDLDILEQKHWYGGGLKGGTTLFGGSSLLYARVGIERASWSFAEEIDVTVDSGVIGVGIESMAAENFSVGVGIDYVTPFNIEAEGHDVTDLFEETESFRGMVRATWHR